MKLTLFAGWEVPKSKSQERKCQIVLREQQLSKWPQKVGTSYRGQDKESVEFRKKPHSKSISNSNDH